MARPLPDYERDHSPAGAAALGSLRSPSLRRSRRGVGLSKGRAIYRKTFTPTNPALSDATDKVKTSGYLKLRPCVDGIIRLSLHIPYKRPSDSPKYACPGCTATRPELQFWIGPEENEASLKEITPTSGDPATGTDFTFELDKNNFSFPLDLVVKTKNRTASGNITAHTMDTCVKFHLVMGCSSCSTTCDLTARPDSGLTTGNPKGGVRTYDDCGQVVTNTDDKFIFSGPSLSIPAGSSNFGDTSASVELNINTADYDGRKLLRFSGSQDIAFAATDGALDSVTTDSRHTTIVDTNVGGHIRTDITIKTPSNTTIRTVSIEKTAANTLTVSTTFQGHTDVMTWVQDGTGDIINWTFTEGTANNGLRTVKNTKTQVDQTTHTDRLTAHDGAIDGPVVSDVFETHKLYTWGWEPDAQEVSPGNGSLTSTWTYFTTGVEGGFLKKAVHPGANNADRTYASAGNTTICTTTRPFADGTSSLIRTTTWDGSKETIEEKVGNFFLSKTETVYGANSKMMKNYSDATHFTTSAITYVDPGVDPNNGGKPAFMAHPDGTISTYVYASGANLTVTSTTGAGSGVEVTEGSQTVTTINVVGQTVESLTTAIGTGTGIVLDHSVASAVDDLGRPTKVLYFPTNGGGEAWNTSTDYGCCGVNSEKDRYGITTSYTYDDLKRRITETRLGVTMQTVYSGLTTSTKRNGVEISKSVSNLSGTYSESWGPSPETGELKMLSSSTTTYGSGATMVTTAALSGDATASQTEEHFPDGRISKSTGTLSPQMKYSYAVNDTGLLTSRSYYIDEANLRETSTSQTDWAGRTTVQTLGTAATTYAYDDAGASPTGRLLSMADADGVTTLYAYNTKGERTTTALDLNGNGTIDYNVDQITESETLPGGYSGYDVLTSTTQVYATSGNNTATTVSTSHRTPDGLRSWTITPGYSTTSSSVVNAVSSSVTVLGDMNHPADRTETTVNPDGTRSVSNYIAGLLTSMEQRDNGAGAGTLIASTTYGYDTLNRPITSTDLRTGATTTEYKSVISDSVKSVTPPAGVTQKVSYAYDHRGLTVSTTLPTLPVSTVTNTAYDESGQAVASWGSQTYPTYTTYDYAHRIKTLRTNPTLAGGVPTNAGGSVTTWNYSTTTGWLTSKRDNADKGATYTQTNAGRLKTRTWARGKHCVYDYVNGRLVATRYFTNNTDNISDTDTPNVGMVYNRLGQRTRMITAAIGGQPGTSIEYTYTAPAFNVSQEAFTIDPDLTFSVDGSGVSVTEGTVEPSIQRVLHRKMDDTLRNAGADLRLTSAANSGLVTGSTLAYSASGRLNTATARLNGADNVFTYGYTANSYGLIASVTGPVHTVTNTWEGDRDVLASKSNAKVSDSSVISSIGYTVNAIGQRTNATRTGAATNSTAWGYDAFGQVIKADDSVNTADRAYLYDAIGNRKKSIEGTTDLPGSDNYTTNPLNQYTAVPSTTSAPEYDLDGNMTAGPLPIAPDVNATLAWNGENRLISVTPTGDSATYLQDAMGRRVLKAVNHSGVITRTYFFYDAWNLLGEYTGPVHTTGAAPNVTLQRTHAWGADLSGSLQGAGGVGGLLATCLNSVSGAPTYYPTYDGNGNVSEYLDGSGDVKSHLEYDPFGNDITPAGTAGSLHNSFPFRFSTKYLDAESGQYHYIGRDYNQSLGRWNNHDPIEESGGLNLYGFVGNDGVDRWDIFGLQYYGPYIPPPTIPESLFSQLPKLAKDKGFNELASLFELWLSRPAYQLPDKRKSSPGEPYNDSIIKMDWVLNFSRAQHAYGDLHDETKYTSPAAKNRIFKLLENAPDGRFGKEWFTPKLTPIERHQYQVQFAHVEGGWGILPDSLDAALHGFSMYSLIGGCKTTVNGRAVVNIDRIGVYVRDSFDFTDEQPLGSWGGYNLHNSSFREYRQHQGMGGDFWVFSDIKTRVLQTPILVSQ